MAKMVTDEEYALAKTIVRVCRRGGRARLTTAHRAHWVDVVTGAVYETFALVVAGGDVHDVDAVVNLDDLAGQVVEAASAGAASRAWQRSALELAVDLLRGRATTEVARIVAYALTDTDAGYAARAAYPPASYRTSDLPPLLEVTVEVPVEVAARGADEESGGAAGDPAERDAEPRRLDRSPA